MRMGIWNSGKTDWDWKGNFKKMVDFCQDGFEAPAEILSGPGFAGLGDLQDLIVLMGIGNSDDRHHLIVGRLR